MAVTRIRRKRKNLVEVRAPTLFNSKSLGYIFCNDPEELIGRRIESMLYHLTELPTHLYVKVKFRIVSVEDRIAYTEFDGLEYFREYIRSLFLRGTSYINVYKTVSVDNKIFRIFVDIFTPKRINTSRKKAIRRVVYPILEGLGKLNMDRFLMEVLYGKVDSEIMSVSKKIYPIRWAGITKIKFVGINEGI